MVTQRGQEDFWELLLNWARAHPSLSAKAAMHLLACTGLPDSGRFRERHARTGSIPTEDGPFPCAWVRNWNTLLADRDAFISGADYRLTKLAASFNDARPVDLRETITRHLGDAQARWVAEAVLIAAGADDRYGAGSLLELDDLTAFWRAVSTGQEGTFGPCRSPADPF